eukprot:6013981-Pyramimonas_sp.AAC.1
MEDKCPYRYSIGHARGIQRTPPRLRECMSRATLAKSGVTDLFYILRAYRYFWSLRAVSYTHLRAHETGAYL